MKITFFYYCECGCEWSTEQFIRHMNFIDSACHCPSCDEENYAEDQQIS